MNRVVAILIYPKQYKSNEKLYIYSKFSLG